MAIKSKLIKNEISPDYPCIGRYPDNMLVLFTDQHTGTVIHQGHSSHKMGTHKDYWINTWEKFDSKVTLTNGQ
jgi:hypothetical protein